MPVEKRPLASAVSTLKGISLSIFLWFLAVCAVDFTLGSLLRHGIITAGIAMSLRDLGRGKATPGTADLAALGALLVANLCLLVLAFRYFRTLLRGHRPLAHRNFGLHQAIVLASLAFCFGLPSLWILTGGQPLLFLIPGILVLLIPVLVTASLEGTLGRALED